MPFFLITGLGGAAKSALVYELRRRGFDALDAEDVEGLTGWRNIRTGETLEGSPPAPVDFQTYRFAWDSEALLRLFSRKGRVFLCGSAWNARQFHPCFEHVFVVMPQKAAAAREAGPQATRCEGRYGARRAAGRERQRDFRRAKHSADRRRDRGRCADIAEAAWPGGLAAAASPASQKDLAADRGSPRGADHAIGFRPEAAGLRRSDRRDSSGN